MALWLHLLSSPSFLAVIAGILSIYFLLKSRASKKTMQHENESTLSPNENPTNNDNDNDTDTECDKEEKVAQIKYTHQRQLTSEQSVQISEQFYRDMNARRSVRDISDRPVDRHIIENILRTAGWVLCFCALFRYFGSGTSPSGAHTQPWTFCVVHDNSIKMQLGDIVEREERINYERRMGDKWVKDVQSKCNTDWQKPYFRTAPYIIVVLKHIYGVDVDDKGHPTGKRLTTYYHEISTSIATGLLLAAIQLSEMSEHISAPVICYRKEVSVDHYDNFHSLSVMAGLVTVTTTPLNAGGAITSLLNRPKNERVMLLLPVGYPSDTAMVPDFTRKALGEIGVFY